jgi:hypothetical protein
VTEVRRIADFIIKLIRGQIELRRRHELAEAITLSSEEKASAPRSCCRCR